MIQYKCGATFDGRCPECGRFVKADKAIRYQGEGWTERLSLDDNATCKVHGRVTMGFEGYFPMEGRVPDAHATTET